MSIETEAAKMKLVSPAMAALPISVRNAALSYIAEGLEENKEKVFATNREDLASAEESGLPEPVRRRLHYGEDKMHDSIEGLRELVGLPDPVGRVLLRRELDEGLVLTRVSVPIGVIGVIFEARPDAMVQVASLCIKSGNCAILKGGREAAQTNRVLFGIIRDAADRAGLPDGCLFQAESHSEIDELLKCDRDVDLIIPRGSNRFVRSIMERTKIPVMGHSSGICHIYVDRDADQEMSVRVILDAKTQYPAACNAVETVLIDRGIADSFLPKLAAALTAAGVRMRGTKEVGEKLEEIAGKFAESGEKPAGIPAGVPAEVSDGVPAEVPAGVPADFEVMGEDEFSTEYGDLILSLKLVDGVEEAVSHINRFGSHHTDCIMTENDQTAGYFLSMVDSAGVYRNCSTRFADGYRYGFGAEVGISTGKLHARGPVGLEGLVTYKYELTGNGQIVGDYASGRKEFHHRDLC